MFKNYILFIYKSSKKTNICTINIILRLRCSVGSSIYFFMTTKKVIFYFLKYYHAANPFIRKLCQLSDQRRGISFFIIIIHHCLRTTVQKFRIRFEILAGKCKWSKYLEYRITFPQIVHWRIYVKIKLFFRKSDFYTQFWFACNWF